MNQKLNDRVRSQFKKNLQDYYSQLDYQSDDFPSDEELNKQLKRNNRLLAIAIGVFVAGIIGIIYLISKY